MAVVLDYDVAALQLRPLRRTIPQHIRNQHPPGLCGAELLGQFLIQLLDGDTQITPDDLSALDQLLHNRADHVAGNRKPDPHVPSALAENGGIDANQFAAGIDQRPS